MPTIDEKPLTLPSEVELDQARKAFRDATEAVMGVTFQIHQMARLGYDHTEKEIREAPIESLPTFLEIGRLFSYLEDARQDVKEIKNYVEEAAKALTDLDYVREIRSRNG